MFQRAPRSIAPSNSNRITYPHRYPHRNLRRLANFIQRLVLFLLLLLIVAAVLVALYDTTQQLVQSERPSRVSDLAISFGTYIVIAILGLVIIVSRSLMTRAMISAIPKGYLPTKSEDVPEPAYDLISTEYDRAAVISHISQPKGRQHEGWGRPGSEYANVHFRSSILSTAKVLRNLLDKMFLETPSQSRASTLSPLSLLTIQDPSPIPEALKPLAELYEKHLLDAKYSVREPEEEDWLEVVKIVAVFIGVLGGGTQ